MFRYFDFNVLCKECKKNRSKTTNHNKILIKYSTQKNHISQTYYPARRSLDFCWVKSCEANRNRNKRKITLELDQIPSSFFSSVSQILGALCSNFSLEESHFHTKLYQNPSLSSFQPFSLFQINRHVLVSGMVMTEFYDKSFAFILNETSLVFHR